MNSIMSGRLDDLSPVQNGIREILGSATGPLTAYEILNRLQTRTAVSPPTVYRNLARLIEHGLVHRIETLNAYIACPGHHHGELAAFAICSRCGKVEELSDPGISRSLHAWSEARAFRLEGTGLELKGLCAAYSH
ncbi:Fur family transcriptional regulator [Microvirga makkahensis]|uniref:Ferric uptake regulation protein n=1 Tax=Microvirga makkahensis TaxID=1128670 RepID=A0A7X3MVI7_9HYPH|nr:Fur family transcriptional regulator [Microvirga makkahensis]MXQ14033.1 transcriptional repressor [Microvirga makkahensis]